MRRIGEFGFSRTSVCTLMHGGKRTCSYCVGNLMACAPTYKFRASHRCWFSPPNQQKYAEMGMCRIGEFAFSRTSVCTLMQGGTRACLNCVGNSMTCAPTYSYKASNKCCFFASKPAKICENGDSQNKRGRFFQNKRMYPNARWYAGLLILRRQSDDMRTYIQIQGER